MKKSFYLLFFLLGLAVNHLYAQDGDDSTIILHVEGDLPEDRNGKLKEKMSENARIFLDALSNAVLDIGTSPVIGSKIMTETAKQEFRTLWENGQFSCNQTEVNATLVKYSHLAVKDKKECAYEIEGIPVAIQKQEDAVPKVLNILFNGQGKICGLTFSLNRTITRNITDKEGSELDLNRQGIIMRFLEEFATAYNRKDMDFLKKVYSDDALIIVGRTIQKKDNKIALTNSDFKGVSKKNVEYLKRSKSEYLDKLQSVFNANDYIDVEFDSIKITKHPNLSQRYKNQYCINLNQYWHSSKKNGTSYKDKGYLFLLVNFDDLDHPTIQIRTWQDMKDTEPDDRITIYNINQ